MTDRMTAAPSGWLTTEQLDYVESDTDQDVDDLTYLVDHRHFHLLVEMARAALHHQAALETATDLPLGEVIAAWRAVKKCTDEFLPEYPGACEEYKSVLHEQLNALEAKR